jgi:hypothetical protein
VAELTQTEIEAKLTALDAQIATLTGTLGSGAGAAAFSDYKIGNLSVNGSQQLEQLIKARDYYQDLLQRIPATTADVSTYDINIDGRDGTDLLGDE